MSEVKKVEDLSHLLPKHTSEALGRLNKYLPSPDDKLSFLLKSHLILERNLLDFVITKGKNDTFFSKEYLKTSRFNHLLRLAKALDHNKKIPMIVWETLFELNKLRNKVAHELEMTITDIENALDNLIKVFFEKQFPEMNMNDFKYEPYSYTIWFMNTTLAIESGHDDMFGKDGSFTNFFERKNKPLL